MKKGLSGRAVVKTKRGAVRRRDRLIRACYRDLEGGTQYGVDMPTIRVTFPDRYAELMDLQEAFPRLPD